LESLHHELPVHKTLKGSEPFDPTHLEMLDLVCEFPYQNSGIGATRMKESLHCELPVREVLKRSEPISALSHFGNLGNGVTSGLGYCVSNSWLLKPRYI
jgi:hypothetical protein